MELTLWLPFLFALVNPLTTFPQRKMASEQALRVAANEAAKELPGTRLYGVLGADAPITAEAITQAINYCSKLEGKRLKTEDAAGP